MSHNHQMMVICPAGVSAGQMLQVQTPDGDDIEFPVPPGIQPGQSFPIQYMDGRQSEGRLRMGSGDIDEDPQEASRLLPQTSMQDDAIHATVSERVFQQSSTPRKKSGFALAEPRFAGLRAKEETISFTFDNLGLSVKTPDGGDLKVLKGVTGKIEARQLVAVMGPSGAGKTTFMVRVEVLFLHRCD
jgi:ABC-type multidrug transport system fused ATPase/permease subunit